jgi:hypothetical protein
MLLRPCGCTGALFMAQTVLHERWKNVSMVFLGRVSSFKSTVREDGMSWLSRTQLTTIWSSVSGAWLHGGQAIYHARPHPSLLCRPHTSLNSQPNMNFKFQQTHTSFKLYQLCNTNVGSSTIPLLRIIKCTPNRYTNCQVDWHVALTQRSVLLVWPSNKIGLK